MKIMVQTPLKNNEIKNLLDGLEFEGIKFTFAGKKGIGLEFEVEGGEAESACAAAKRAIKSEDWGKVLYFSVVAS